jgi:hypothetical protein
MKSQEERDLDYFREKFGRAVNIMATSPAGLKERIHNAWLIFHTVRSNDLTDEEDLKTDYERLLGMLTQYDGPEGKMEATLSRLSTDELVEIAELIVALNERANSIVLFESDRLRGPGS